MKRLIPVVLTLAVGLSLWACSSAEYGIQIEQAWARPAVEGENSAVYFRITSLGAEDGLLSASTTAAGKTELHRSIMGDDGTMRMEHQDRIELPADEAVELKPGDLHVMLMELKQDLNPGDMVTLLLIFENNDEMEINVPVRTP